MSLADQFQKLDDLIVLHTKPPTTAILRGQLALMHEQIEAYQASSDRQDKTLAAQAEAIEALEKEKAAIQESHRVEIAKLTARNFQPKADALEPQTREILKYFFDKADDVTDGEIARRFRISLNLGSHHIDILIKNRFVTQTRVGFNASSCGFGITSAGREYCVKNGLAT